jgi:Lon protease-like protein
MVLLPTERVPCTSSSRATGSSSANASEEEREFGLLLGDEDGLREIGTRAMVVEVVDRFPDGRLNIVVEGRERFRLVELTEGRSFATGEVRPVADADSVSEREQRDSVGRLFPLASVVEVRAGLKRRGGCSRSRRLATSRVKTRRLRNRARRTDRE